MMKCKFRVGFGYDVHSLADGESLILAGIRVPHTKGTVAHSDGDVVIHAICDALLGAAVRGDIGSNFPDTDDSYKNIDSGVLLSEVVSMLHTDGYSIGNVDVTISAQRPLLKNYIPLMRSRLAEIMAISEGDVSVKATTTERLGFEGREEGISTYASVLIYVSE